jgi:ribosome-dependent ATPase
VLDNDRSPESRELVETFAGSRYFVKQPAVTDLADLERRLKGGRVSVALEIPAGFGRDFWRGADPEVAVWLDGATPFRAETARGYLEALVLRYGQDLAARRGVDGDLLPVSFETRLPFNQRFESVYAIAPGVIMLLLAIIPSMMTALGIVREKEIGSIVNFHATPVSPFEFLLGKQLPYVFIAFGNFVSLWLLTASAFGIDLTGSASALALGAVCYVTATTAFGLLVSTFVRTQIAAVFATSIIIMIPTVNFSGFMTPISSLDEAGRLFGLAFPGGYFQQISIGAFTKGLHWGDLWHNHFALTGFAVGYVLVSMLLLRKQEA